jgi:DNA replication factor GINS
VLRFLQNVDEIVGADLEKYGPFKPEDIATLPYENAQALITKNIATKIHWED